MIRTGNLQSAYEPKFIPQSEIEYDALHLLKCYKPDYLNDIDTEIDYYDFLFEFLPTHLKKSIFGTLSVDFYSKPITDTEGNHIVAYTEADKISVDRTHFDSDEIVDNRICNFTIAHETYHAIKHRGYLKSFEQQQSLFKDDAPRLPQLKRLITLKRDINGKVSNKFCQQANIFASFFIMPKERLRTALLENIGTDSIEIEGIDDNDMYEVRKLVNHIHQHFDVNPKPLAIALKTHGFVREKERTQSLFR